MKPAILYYSLISFCFSLSHKNIISLGKSITIYGTMNANNISVNTSIGANTEFSYGKSLGIEFRPALSRLKGRFRNIYLNIDFSQGGFLKKNIHPLINYEVRKIYKINYFRSAFIYPLPSLIRKLKIRSGLYLGIPISGKIQTVRGGFIQSDRKLKNSYLKNDIGIVFMIKYPLNSHISFRTTLSYGINHSFDYTYEAYKASNRVIGIGVSYLYGSKNK